MFDDKLRSFKDSILNLLVGNWAASINPNLVTIAAFTAGIVAASAILYGKTTIALIFWIINRILDGYDGAIARKFNKQTDKGAFLDIITDFFIYALIPLALAYQQKSLLLWKLTALLLAIYYVNCASWMYLSAIIEKRGHAKESKTLTSIAMPTGLIEGAETIIIYTLFIILPKQLALLFIIMSVSTLVSILQRIWWSRKL